MNRLTLHKIESSPTIDENKGLSANQNTRTPPTHEHVHCKADSFPVFLDDVVFTRYGDDWPLYGSGTHVSDCWNSVYPCTNDLCIKPSNLSHNQKSRTVGFRRFDFDDAVALNGEHGLSDQRYPMGQPDKA